MNYSKLLAQPGKAARIRSGGTQRMAALPHRVRRQSPDHSLSIDVLTNILAEDKYAESEPLLAELHRNQRTQGDPQRNAQYACKYGLLLVKLNRPGEAYQPLAQAYDRLTATNQTTSGEMRRSSSCCHLRSDRADRRRCSFRATARHAARPGRIQFCIRACDAIRPVRPLDGVGPGPVFVASSFQA